MINYSLNNFRGGVRLELRRAHVTLEQGGTTFRDDQSLFQSPGIPNPGNRTTPYLGQTLFLNGLSQAYGVRGDSIYSKVLATAEPAPWIHLYGQFLYSRPENDTTYQQFNTGNFAPSNQAGVRHKPAVPVVIRCAVASSVGKRGRGNAAFFRA